MRLPSITDYILTLENPYGLFRTLPDTIMVDRGVYSDVEFRAGNSAAVFTYSAENGERRFLKCYIRPNPRLREIYGYIENRRSSILPEVRLLPEEIYIYSVSGHEGWADVVEGEWTDGETLDMAVLRAVRSSGSEEGRGLRNLAESFDRLCRILLDEEWAHGDLKPENVVVRPDGSMVLIDCDAMWIPAFAGQKASEVGTPGYCHPARDDSFFDKRIDDYSMLLISSTLHALSVKPELYDRYDTPDNMLLSPAEVVAGRCPAYEELLDIFDEAGMGRERRMAELLASPTSLIPDIGLFFT